MLNHLGFFFFAFFFLRLGLGQRRAVVIIGRWLLPSLVDTGDICCHYWQHILVNIETGPSPRDWFMEFEMTKSCNAIRNFRHFFSCDQAALQMVFSVCLSVRPSVRLSVCLSVRPSHLFDYVPIIVSSWNFQELLPVTEVTSMQKVKVRGQRSRSQRSQPNLTVSGL